MVGPFDSAREYERVGDQFAQLLKDRCGLRPDGRVLDAGCGCGQVAGPLTGYLTSGGYKGFDIQPVLIDWCREHITPAHPNFQFETADVFNRVYNPAGKVAPDKYRFSCENASVDCAIAKSLLTHMLPPELERYLAETARALKPGGRCLITYFLLNERSLKAVAARKSPMEFDHFLGPCRTVDPDFPESALAYDETFLFGAYEKVGLKIETPVHYGNWPERFDVMDFQDYVVARKQG